MELLSQEQLSITVPIYLGIIIVILGTFVAAPCLLGIKDKHGRFSPPPHLKTRIIASLITQIIVGPVTLFSIAVLFFVLSFALSTVLPIFCFDSILLYVISFGGGVMAATFVGMLMLRSLLKEYPKARWKLLALTSFVLSISFIIGYGFIGSAWNREEHFVIAKSDDHSNLRTIETAISSYKDTRGRLPTSLQQMKEDNKLKEEYLQYLCDFDYSAMTRNKNPDEILSKYSYIPLPINAPDNLVLVWHDVGLLDNRGAFVLRKSGRIDWVPTKDMMKEVLPSYRWLIEHSSPVSSQSTATYPNPSK